MAECPSQQDQRMCQHYPGRKKKKKRNNNVRIIPKLGLILYMEFSGTPSSIPSFPRFLSPLPITFSQRIKKRASWMSRSISFSYTAARIQGYTPPWLVLSSLPPLILFLSPSRVHGMGVERGPLPFDGWNCTDVPSGSNLLRLLWKYPCRWVLLQSSVSMEQV